MNPVCSGATLLCSCGTAPSVLQISPHGVSHSRLFVSATVSDCVPLVNIPPFGSCTAPCNPQPPVGPFRACVPSFSSVWSAEAPSISIHRQAVLDDSATLSCAYGGTVRILNPGQTIARHNSTAIAAGPAAASLRSPR